MSKSKAPSLSCSQPVCLTEKARSTDDPDATVWTPDLFATPAASDSLKGNDRLEADPTVMGWALVLKEAHGPRGRQPAAYPTERHDASTADRDPPLPVRLVSR